METCRMWLFRYLIECLQSRVYFDFSGQVIVPFVLDLSVTFTPLKEKLNRKPTMVMEICMSGYTMV